MGQKESENSEKDIFTEGPGFSIRWNSVKIRSFIRQRKNSKSSSNIRCGSVGRLKNQNKIGVKHIFQCFRCLAISYFRFFLENFSSNIESGVK